MSGYSVDLRKRIVSSVEGGMSKAQAARIFSVSLSSVKRYLQKAQRGESLVPKKRPGSAPKLGDSAMRLLEEDLRVSISLQTASCSTSAGYSSSRSLIDRPPFDVEPKSQSIVMIRRRPRSAGRRT
jgi:transposase-like protein